VVRGDQQPIIAGKDQPVDRRPHRRTRLGFGTSASVVVLHSVGFERHHASDG